MKKPPDGLPAFRLVTGPDDAGFCHRLSEAPGLGYRRHGAPSVRVSGDRGVAAQAVLWPS